jgi:hypothetical protein
MIDMQCCTFAVGAEFSYILSISGSKVSNVIKLEEQNNMNT